MGGDEAGHLGSLDERAYLELRDLIVRGALRPGEQLVQETLAGRLGVSRTPLRRAIATLAQQGFVELTPRGPAFVRSFSDDELDSVWEIRAVLEGLVSRIAAGRARRHDVAYLRSLLGSAMDRITPDDWSAYQEADREFHGYIAQVVADPLLTRILDAYQILSIALAQGLLRPPAETLPEHLEILDAIEAGDAERAERAMVQHIRSSKRYLKSRSAARAGGGLPPGFAAAAEEAVRELAAATMETAVAIRRDEGEALVLAAAEPERMLRVSCAVGTRLPLAGTPLERALAGHGEGEGAAEVEAGVRALAYPVRHGGAVVAALALLVPAPRMGEDRTALEVALRAAAERIERVVGGG